LWNRRGTLGVFCFVRTGNLAADSGKGRITGTPSDALSNRTGCHPNASLASQGLKLGDWLPDNNELAGLMGQVVVVATY
jgi:hypothetical protein